MDKDCEFLEQEKIMDYSLLVGVHFRGKRDMPANLMVGRHTQNADLVILIG